MSKLEAFKDVVSFRESGVEHNMIVLAVKDKGVIDGVFVRQLLGPDGKTPLNVVGSSRQAEMIQFRHDVPPSQYRTVEDWFFSLSDDELQAVLAERQRRIHEKQQADQAKASQEEEKQLVSGVVIKPSPALLEKAGQLWKQAIRDSQELDEHSEISLPEFEKSPEQWKPWIERAKSSLVAPQAPIDKASEQAEGKGKKGGSKDPQVN